MDYFSVTRKTAYSASYVEEVMENLGYMCHCSVVLFHTPLEVLIPKFLDSPFAYGIEHGNPHYMVGYHGMEIAERLLGKRYGSNIYYTEGDIWFWVGRSLALVQWYTCYKFKALLDMQPLEYWYHIYRVYHTMDESKLLDWAGGVYLADRNSEYYQYLIHGMPDRKTW